jgi:hypothetical protein
MKYLVKHAFADRQPGDVFEAGKLSEVDTAYLLQIGAIVANESAEPTPKRARKVPSESEA